MKAVYNHFLTLYKKQSSKTVLKRVQSGIGLFDDSRLQLRKIGLDL